jgi:integrase
VHLGYRRLEAGNGSWTVKRLTGRTTGGGGQYSTQVFAEADDFSEANGASILDYYGAMAKVGGELSNVQRRRQYGVADAVKDYVTYLRVHKRSGDDAELKLKAYLVEYFGNKLLSDVKSSEFDKWVAWALEHQPRGPAKPKPPMKRGPYKTKGTAKPKAEPPVISAEERKRRKRSTLNRIINYVKAALTRAYLDGHVSSDEAWRRLRKFKGADSARIQWLTTEQSRRLINACAPDFRRIVHAGLLTGARWSELRALQARDFDATSGTIHVATSKSGKPRRVPLTDEGKRAFESWTAGKPESALVFEDRDGAGWGSHDQIRRMADACVGAKIWPAVGFHTLRHSYASALVQAGVSLAIVAEALGHGDTRMVGQHYGHLSPSHVADAIRANLPSLGVNIDSTLPTP